MKCISLLWPAMSYQHNFLYLIPSPHIKNKLSVFHHRDLLGRAYFGEMEIGENVLLLTQSIKQEMFHLK